ncbi:MAG: S8 family peptidase [Lachnospiraceae bacterium]|nr:S8 family peptidase [Lachnospiraceae bacterium]
MNHVASAINLNYAIRQGLTGRGIGIAVMDTGIGSHPDLTEPGGCLAGFFDTVNRHSNYYDDNGHGTHIAGIIAGNGSASNGLYRGIAPESRIYMVKILNSRGEGNTGNVLEGINWILNNQKKYNIRIVNISVGSTRNKHFDENSPLVMGVNKLWSAGIVVLTAAGNHGPGPYSIGAPGNSRKIITVGASDVMQYGNGRDYSGRGPTNSCIKKPDIVAPGSDVISCMPASKMIFPAFNKYFSRESQLKQYYKARSGTSMSTPVVSGCIALLLQKHPEMTNRDVKLHLRNTAYDLGYSHSRQGWGLIQCNRLLA